MVEAQRNLMVFSLLLLSGTNESSAGCRIGSACAARQIGPMLPRLRVFDLEVGL